MYLKEKQHIYLSDCETLMVMIVNPPPLVEVHIYYYAFNLTSY